MQIQTQLIGHTKVEEGGVLEEVIIAFIFRRPIKTVLNRSLNSLKQVKMTFETVNVSANQIWSYITEHAPPKHELKKSENKKSNPEVSNWTHEVDVSSHQHVAEFMIFWRGF